MHAGTRLMPRDRPSQDDPPRRGGRGAKDEERYQTGSAGSRHAGALPRGERGGHLEAHPEQHGVEGRAGDRLRGDPDGGRDPGFRLPRRRVPGPRDDDEQREPTRPRRAPHGSPQPEHDGPERADRVRGLWGRRSRLRDPPDLLHRLARAAPRAEGRLLRSGRGPRIGGGGRRVRGILAVRPQRGPGARSRGLRVPRESGFERLRRRAGFDVEPPESAELLRNDLLGEPGELEPRRLDPHDGLLGPVRGQRWTGSGRLPRGGPPAISRELPVQALGRAAGWPRNPPPPVHLWAALTAAHPFLFSSLNGSSHNLISGWTIAGSWSSRPSGTCGSTKASTMSG